MEAVHSIALNERVLFRGCSEHDSLTSLAHRQQQACHALQKLTLSNSNSDLQAEALDAFSAPAELPDLAEANAEHSEQSDEPDEPNSKRRRSPNRNCASAGPPMHSAPHPPESEVARSRSVHDNVQGKLCLAWAVLSELE